MVEKGCPESFKKITLEYTVNYIEQNAPQDKAWFKSVAYEIRPKKRRVPQYNPDGSPIMIISKDGKQRQKAKMEVIPGSEQKPIFSLLKAKQAFCERYMPEIIPKSKAKGPKADDLLADW